MGRLEDYCKCVRKKDPEEWNKICEINGIYGMYRVEFENYINSST